MDGESLHPSPFLESGYIARAESLNFLLQLELQIAPLTLLVQDISTAGCCFAIIVAFSKRQILSFLGVNFECRVRSTCLQSCLVQVCHYSAFSMLFLYACILWMFPPLVCENEFPKDMFQQSIVDSLCSHCYHYIPLISLTLRSCKFMLGLQMDAHSMLSLSGLDFCHSIMLGSVRPTHTSPRLLPHQLHCLFFKWTTYRNPL